MANAIISKIQLPNGNVYDLADAFSREQIEQLKKTVAGGVQYIGATTTQMSDGLTTAAVTITKGDGTTEDHTAVVGDMVDYENVLYIYNKSGQWDQLGSAGPLKALAYKDSVSANYTPVGTISAPTFTGSALTSTGSVTPTGTVSAPAFTGAKSEISVSGTPQGTVSAPEFTGTEATISVSGTPKGSVAVTTSAVGKDQTATYTPSGTVTVTPTTGTVKQVTGVGTLPELTTSVANETLTIGFNAGTLPTAADATVATGVTSAVFTGAGVMLNGSFTGEATSSTGKYTPAGTNTAPTFTGTDLTSTGDYTPSGEVAAPTFTGKAADVSVTGTPAGTVSAPTFTGTEATIVSK